MRGHRLDDGFGHRRNGCLVDDIIGTAQMSFEIRGICEIELDKFDVATNGVDILATAGRKIIDHSYRLVPPKQLFNDMRTDKTTSPGHHIHGHQLPPSNWSTFTTLR